MTLNISTVSIILITLTLISFIIKKDLFAPDVIFPAMWAVATFLSSLRLYDIDEIRDSRTSWIILVGTLSFIFGSAASQKLKRKKETKISRRYNKELIQKKDINFLIPERYLFWLFLFFIIFYIKDIFRVINALKSGIGFDLLRGAYFGLNVGENFNKSDSILKTYLSSFVMGIQSVFSIVCIQYFTIDVKKYKKCFIYSAILLIIQVFISAGRLEMGVFAMQIMASFFSSRGNNISNYISKKLERIKLLKRQNKILLLLLTILISAVLYITERRGIDSGVGLRRHIYIYLSGGITLMDKRLAVLDYSGFTYSAAGFYGFWSLILPVFHFIGFGYPNFYTNAVYHVIEPLQVPVQIGYKSYINAFVTTFFHVYADLGWVGLFLGMFLWGLIAGRSYVNMKKNFLSFDTTLYLLFIGTMLLGINHYPFVSRGNIIAIAIIWIMKSRRFSFTMNFKYMTRKKVGRNARNKK